MVLAEHRDLDLDAALAEAEADDGRPVLEDDLWAKSDFRVGLVGRRVADDEAHDCRVFLFSFCLLVCCVSRLICPMNRSDGFWALVSTRGRKNIR